MTAPISYTSAALVRLGAAYVSLGAIRDSYEIGPVLRGKLDAAMEAILSVSNQWPGAGLSVSRIDEWIRSAAREGIMDRDTPGTMAVLANTASQAVADLYEMRQTRTRGLCPLVEPLIGLLDAIVESVSGRRESQWAACATAEIAAARLAEVVGG